MSMESSLDTPISAPPTESKIIVVVPEVLVTSSIKLLPILSSLASKKSVLQAINHEMRTPLSAALCGLDLLNDTELPLEAKVQMVEIIKQSVMCATEALNDAILQDLLSRKELFLNMTTTDLAKMIQIILDALIIDANHRHIKVEFHTYPNRPLFVSTDAIRMSQILRNILLFAMRAAPDEGTYAVFLTKYEEIVRIEIHIKSSINIVPLKRRNSNGLLTEQFQPLLYESLIPYEAVLGMHGGTMGAMHHQELVFAYCIDIPCYKNDFIVPQAVVIPKRPRLRFLIVDDSDLCRKVVMTKMQTSYQALCEEAENGADAVVKIFTAHKEGKEYDCIIMDNTMPILGGALATSIIRSYGYEGKIFGATGNVLPDELAHFKAQGLDEVFTKPLRTADYDMIFQSACGNSVFEV